jgi:transcriptional regulator with XRE-family HTH domain
VRTSRSVAEARRQADRIHRNLADDLRRLREDAGASRSQLAQAAGVDLGFLCRIEDGRERPSIDTYSKLALALGSDLTARVYPNTGPAIRDRHQARIVEALVAQLHPRWQPALEAGVRKPARGWIDVVMFEARERIAIATEVQSDLRRLEQLLRWAQLKVEALPSWERWPSLGDPAPMTSRLLVVRSTQATRSVAREFASLLATEYPAHPADALASLFGDARWPGPALVWARIEPSRVRFLERR